MEPVPRFATESCKIGLHLWGDWQDKGGEREYKKCQRCGETEERKIVHRPPSRKYDPYGDL